MQKFLRTLMLVALMLVPFASQAQGDCTPISTYPVTYGFEASEGFTTTVTAAAACTTNVFNSCWRNEQTSISGSSGSGRIWHIYGGTTTSQIHGGAHSLMLPDKGSSSAVSTTMLVFPAMSFTSNYGYVVSFWIYRSGSSSNPEGFKMYVSNTDTIDANAVELGHYSRNYGIAYPVAESASGWYQYETAPITMTGTVYLIFEGQSYYGSSTYVDDVVIEEILPCSKVTDLTVSATTASSMTLTWADAANNGATYIVSDASGVIASGITATTYTVTNLNSNTEYTFSVTADCGNDGLSGVKTVTGRTACGVIGLPYTCGFEVNELQGNSSNAERLPWCWTRYASGTGSYTYYPYSNTSYVHEGSRALYFYCGTSTTYPDTQVVILPEVDVQTYPMNGNRVTFWARMSSASYSNTVYVGTVTDPTDPSTFVPVGTVQVSGNVHTKYAVPMTAAAGSVLGPYVAIVSLRNTTAQGYMTLDDLTLEEMPSCLEVANLAVSNVTSSSMTLTWTDASNTNASYTVYDMADSSVIATGVTANTYTVTGLDANTQYTFGVQANCTAGDAGMMTVTGRTDCAVEVLPFTEDFSADLSSNVCWRGATGTTADQVFSGTALTLTTPNWTYASSANSGIAAGHYYKNIYGTSCKNWIITPAIDLSTVTSAQLSFDAVFTGYNSATAASGFENNSSQVFMVIVSADGGNTWLETNATKWQNENGNYTLASLAGTSYINQVISLNQFIGDTIKIAFYAQSTTSGGDNNLHIDNIAVTEVPNCPAPYGLAVAYNGGTTAIVSWNGEANGYNLNINGTTTYNVNNPDTITGLDLSTTYTFMVQSACGNDTSVWSNPVSITTDMCTTDDQCFITLSLTDSFGDSWNGNAINVIDSITGTVLGQYTNLNAGAGEAEIYTVGVCSGRPLQFSWVSGSYPGEASFTILDGGNTAVFSGSGSNMTGGQVFFSLSNPCPNCLPVTDLTASNVTATSATISWTGTAASYDVYNGTTLVAAGITATTYTFTGLTAATAYTFGVVANCSADDASGIATIIVNTDCADGSCRVTIAGVDSYGDGWNGNTITMTQSGVATSFTLADGNSLTESYCVTSGVPVTFSWTTGSYPSETSFDIYNGNNVVVYSVSNGSTLSDGVFFTLNDACSNDTTGGDTTVVVPDTISITYAVNDATMGTTNPAPGTYQYEEGTVFSVTAVPNAGYHLADWTITMNIPGYGPYSYALGTTETTIGDTAGLDFDGIIITAMFASDSTGDTTATCDPITVFPYTQDFSAAPACWSVIDADGDGYNWELIAGAVHSASYDNNVGALTPDNWLVTPQFQLAAGTNYEVTWNANPQDTSWPAEHYGIYVSTTTADTAAFTLLQEWTLTAAGNVPVVSLNNYAGQTIYLAFRHWNCTDMFRIAIDNFQLREAAGANQVTVTLTQNNPMYGSVAGGGVYTIGDSVIVTATPAANYMFVNWADANGATVSTANPYTFVAATDITLQAIFQADNSQADSIVVTYTVNDTTMGSITPSGDHYVHVGDAIQAAATPNAGYMLDAWVLTSYLAGTAVGADTLTTDSLGFANPMNFGTLPQVYADYGATITVTAIFAVDTNASTEDSLTVILAVNDATMGTTNPVPGTYVYGVGDSLIFTALPNDGYHVENIIYTISYMGFNMTDTLDATVVSVSEVVDSNMLGAVITVLVNFAADSTPQPVYWTVELSANDDEAGSVSPAGISQVLDGASFTATATANEGYYFSAWMSGQTVLSEDAVFTFTVSTNISLVAVFLPDSVVPPTRYHIVGEPNDPAMGEVSGSGYYEDGEVATLIAIAHDGYRFVRWSTGETTDTIYITVDGEDVTVTAIFEAVSGIEDADMNDVTIYSTDSKIVVRGAEGSAVYVFDVNGRLVSNMNNATETVEFRMANTGVYLVKVGAAPAKRVLVVR